MRNKLLSPIEALLALMLTAVNPCQAALPGTLMVEFSGAPSSGINYIQPLPDKDGAIDGNVSLLLIYKGKATEISLMGSMPTPPSKVKSVTGRLWTKDGIPHMSFGPMNPAEKELDSALIVANAAKQDGTPLVATLIVSLTKPEANNTMYALEQTVLDLPTTIKFLEGLKTNGQLMTIKFVEDKKKSPTVAFINL